MSRRFTYIVLSSVALICGGLIYILFRENSYVGNLFINFAFIKYIKEIAGWLECDFIKFYFPDFLWSFSLCLALYAIYTPNKTGEMICSLIVFMIGIFWELMQYWNIIRGTGDICDIFMYLLASITCIIISIRREKDEKN